MKTVRSWAECGAVLLMILMVSATWGQSRPVDRGGPPHGVEAVSAGGEWDQEPPPAPPPGPAGPERPAPLPPQPPQPPGPPGQSGQPVPPGPQAPPAGAPPAAGPLRAPLGPRQPADDGLIPLIAEHKPELAERLAQLRRRAPERFRRMIVETLLPHLDELMRRMEEEPVPAGPPGEPGPGEPGRPPLAGPGRGPHPEPMPPEMRARVRELEEQHAKLEERARQLVRRLRGPEADSISAEERTALREELSRVLNEQFDTRTELRRLELQRMEQELNRLREMLERRRKDFDARQQQRGPIIERRANQLLGEDPTEW